MCDIINVQHEGQSETSKLVPCVSCGMYSLFNSDNYLLIESMNTINNDGNIHYTCNTCKDNISMSYQIEDLNRKVTKLRERVASLKLIRSIENEIDKSASNMLTNSLLADSTADDLTTQFAGLSLSSSIPLPSSNITIEQSMHSYLDNASYNTSVWESESNSTACFDYNHPSPASSSISSISGISENQDTTESLIHTQPSDEQITDENAYQEPSSEQSPSATPFVDTVMITDSTLSGIEFQRESNIKAANYPSAKMENVIRTIDFFSSKYDKLDSIIVHTGTNDIKYGKKTEEVKKSFRNLLSTTKGLQKKLIISGPVPVVKCSGEHFSRIAALNSWLEKWCSENNIDFVNNFETEWSKLNLYNYLGTKLNFNGKHQLLKNIDHIFKESFTD